MPDVLRPVIAAVVNGFNPSGTGKAPQTLGTRIPRSTSDLSLPAWVTVFGGRSLEQNGN